MAELDKYIVGQKMQNVLLLLCATAIVVSCWLMISRGGLSENIIMIGPQCGENEIAVWPN